MPQRIPVVTPRLGLAVFHLKEAGLAQALHPALVYVLTTQQLATFPDRCRVVDLTHVLGHASGAALRTMMSVMDMEPVPLHAVQAEIDEWEQQQKAAAAIPVL